MAADNSNQDREIDRRNFLKYAVGVAGLVVASGAISCIPVEWSRPSEMQTVENPYIKFTSPESISLKPLITVPDIQTPVFTNSKGELTGIITAGQNSYLMTIDRDGQKIAVPSLKSVTGPDNSQDKKSYRNGYTGVSSVIQLDPTNPDFLIGALDCEQHAVDSSGQRVWYQFRGRVAYGISQDGGKTWEDRGVIIEGHDSIEPGAPSPLANNEIRPTGAIHPWMIKISVSDKNYIYTYYTDLTSNIKRPNQICLSRAVVDSRGNLGEQELWTDSGFVSSGEKKKVEPKGVFKMPNGGQYTAIPSVYKHGNEYLALFESENGFYMTKSSDALTWIEPTAVVKFLTGVNKAKAQGGKWFSNPTLYSLDQPSNSTLGKSGYMIFSEGTSAGRDSKFIEEPHQARRMKFELKG